MISAQKIFLQTWTSLTYHPVSAESTHETVTNLKLKKIINRIKRRNIKEKKARQ
jgi:hypothetical protein